MPSPEPSLRDGPPPGHVEFVGLPGAGKSHAYHRLDWARLGRAGAFRAHEALLRTLGAQRDLPPGVRWISTGARLAGLYGAAPHLLRVSLARLTAAFSIEAEECSLSSLRAICEHVPAERLPSWSAFTVLERLAAREATESWGGPRVVIWDEGLVQLGLHTVRTGTATAVERAAAYAAAVRRPAVVVLVDAPDELIRERLSARNGTPRPVDPAGMRRADARIPELRAVMAVVTEVLERRGCTILRARGVEGAPDPTDRILDALQYRSIEGSGVLPDDA